MKISPAESTSQPACRLHSEAFDAVIRIDGIAAEELQARLFEDGKPWPWQQLAKRGTITVALENPTTDRPPAQPAKPVTRSLPDGQVRLISGQPGELVVAPDHQDPDSLLPASLNLCLAQQWARAGLAPIHGATFSLQGTGVLAIGGKGAGKSTLTAAALIAGGQVVSDDWVLLGCDKEVPTVERIRSFLMLRSSWATDQIRNILPKNLFRPHPNRPKFTVRLPADHPRFPTSARIHQIWYLQRPPNGRQVNMAIKPVNPTETLAALIESSMPLLFSQDLPVERTALLSCFQRLISNTDRRGVTTGTELIGSPKSAIPQLLKAAGSQTPPPA